MKMSSTARRLQFLAALILTVAFSSLLMSSSHREAPMIADDPTADNTDVYAFRSPRNANKVILVANYIPFQLPDAGPNYYHFAEDVRYEIHVDNNISTMGDDIVYRFTFKRMNEDPTTFFSIRLGKENLKTTYTLERSMDGGRSFQTIVANGKVPPPNVGPRSISSPVGLSASDYKMLMKNSIMTASTGERVFAGPIEDPFFVDAGGAFDLGDIPRTSGGKSKDVLRCKNVHSLTLEIDIATLQKDKKPASQATSILDPNYVIGVWASASRQKMRVLNSDGTKTNSGEWIQVSRLGMPLTNEVVIPIGMKDKWNMSSPYDAAANALFAPYFYNPELALYMDEAFFASAVPALTPLRIQKNSLGMFGFGNTQDGLFPLKGSPALNGTALAESAFGSVLLPGPGKPRSVDLFPLFHTGVPNLRPYQLGITKGGNPLAEGKPFIHNFLPNGGDMLRLNMATPTTNRKSSAFSNLGLVYALSLAFVDSRYHNNNLEFIPNMDGFPNGRRLEDDVTRIELQAVSGYVLGAIGLYYDDFRPGINPVTQRARAVYNYHTRINRNDLPISNEFPFVNAPFPGNGPDVCKECDDNNDQGRTEAPLASPETNTLPEGLGLNTPGVMLSTQSPVVSINTVRYHVSTPSRVQIVVFDVSGKKLQVLVDKQHEAGTYNVQWNTSRISKGSYLISANQNGQASKTVQVVKN
jgi:hypothetical protein